ncbi:MAG TPA: Rne/Rng family ribonuclease [Blastocatellia bacterium]|nr:Rne/Rng family ribonuclease [Blastocatellia bacterium]
MAKEMIISSNRFERKIAILEDGVLVEYYVERAGESEGIVGNIYKGRVTRVLPGMQSAFVDIGLDRDAFLYVSDVFDIEDMEVEFEPAGEAERASASGRTPPSTEPSFADVEQIIEALAETKPSRPARRRRVEEPSEEALTEEIADLVESITADLPPPGGEPAGEEEKEVASEVDLKDAIVEEKIIEAIHQEEALIEPTEDVVESEHRIGSFSLPLTSGTKRRRIVDDAPAMTPESVEELAPSPAESSEEMDARSVETQPPSSEGVPPPSEGPQPPTSVEVMEHAGGTVSALSAEEGEGVAPPEEAGSDKPAESAAEDPEPPLPDADASLRYSYKPRAEMANRRRSRRRRHTAAVAEAEPDPVRNEPKGEPTITELLKEGQEILVQIAKEPIGNKGARVTTHIALPGRYLVYMPTSEHVGVSRRITSAAERARLRRLITELKNRERVVGGLIVRTAAEGCSEADLLSDLQYLAHTWNDIRQRAERTKAPALLHRDLDLVERILRDRLSSDFTAIRVDDEEDYTRIVDFVSRFQPKLLNRVKLHTRETPIFEEYGVQAEIEKSIRPRVWLKSGGYIVINQTEALVAIDVNTGKFVGRTSRFEDTITRTNIEAAREIARQIRVRDLGGIIVLDFIDMEERKNRQKVMQVLEEELRKDRAPTKILQFNDFGLVAITRKRVKQSLERTLCEPCPYCHGSGLVKSPQTICLEILEEARRLAMAGERVDGGEALLRVHPEVGRLLRERYAAILHEIEAYLGGPVTIKTDPLLHQEQFDIAIV